MKDIFIKKLCLIFDIFFMFEQGCTSEEAESALWGYVEEKFPGSIDEVFTDGE